MCSAFPLDWPVMFPSDSFVLSASFVSLVLLASLVFVQNMVFFFLILLFFWFPYIALKHLKISQTEACGTSRCKSAIINMITKTNITIIIRLIIYHRPLKKPLHRLLSQQEITCFVYVYLFLLS